MKKILTVFMVCSLFFGIAGCSTDKTKETTENTEETTDKYSTIITETTMSDIEKKIENKESFSFLMMMTGCSWCEKQKPVLEKYINETGEKVYYVNLVEDKTAIITEEGSGDTLVQYIENLEHMKFQGTPNILVYKDGVLSKNNVGYMEYNDLKSFFEK